MSIIAHYKKIFNAVNLIFNFIFFSFYVGLQFRLNFLCFLGFLFVVCFFVHLFGDFVQEVINFFVYVLIVSGVGFKIIMGKYFFNFRIKCAWFTLKSPDFPFCLFILFINRAKQFSQYWKTLYFRNFEYMSYSMVILLLPL